MMGQSDDVYSVIAAIYDTSIEEQRPPGNNCSRIREESTTCFTCGSRELSGMWLRWSLTTLYLLQLLVLSSMVAAYIVNNVSKTRTSGPSSSLSPLAADELPTKVQQTEDDQLTVELRPLSLADVQNNLQNVTSPIDLVRMFSSRTDVSDEQIAQFLEQGGGHRLSPEEHGAPEPGGGQPKKSKKKGGVVNITGVQGWSEDPMDYASDQPSSNQHEIFLAAVHNGLTQNGLDRFPCKAPTPFIHRVYDPTHPEKFFLPDCVQLHRCFNYSGCCRSRMLECVPKKVDIVQMAFLTFKMDDPVLDLMNFDTGHAVVLSFENHTECECRPRRHHTNLSSCPLQCPEPFTLKAWGAECTCDCSSEGRTDDGAADQCKRIKKGRIMLNETGLVCIKENNCYQPSCEVGIFNLLTGYCPLSNDYALPRYMFNSSEDQQRRFRDHLDNGHLNYTTAPRPTFSFFSRSTAAPPTLPWDSRDMAPLKEPFASHHYHENAKSRKWNGTKTAAPDATSRNVSDASVNSTQEVSPTTTTTSHASSGNPRTRARNVTKAKTSTTWPPATSATPPPLRGNESVGLSLGQGVSSSRAYHENSHNRTTKNGAKDRRKEPKNGRRWRKKTLPPSATSRNNTDKLSGRDVEVSSSHVFHEDSHNRMRNGARNRLKEPQARQASFNATAATTPKLTPFSAHSTLSGSSTPVNASAPSTNNKESVTPLSPTEPRPQSDMPRRASVNKDGFSKRSLRHHHHHHHHRAPEQVKKGKPSPEPSQDEDIDSDELTESSRSGRDSEGSGDEDHY